MDFQWKTVLNNKSINIADTSSYAVLKHEALGVLFPCSPEINWLVPVPQFSYVPCSPILSLFPSNIELYITECIRGSSNKE